MIDTILMILAIICFLVAAFGVNTRNVQVGWIGLALWALTALV